ncbi:MAG: SpoVA/SpoVAEb family sporulation membrane protein, partial [Clostridia bacterium]|nr:SpoVA/SpoVAEb family sporulation membrane protein [Clostridia bacterium]
MGYVKAFAVGGFVCMIAQILINKTKMTSARILVMFLLLGVFLELIGVFKYIENFAGAGITIPITGFGSTIVKGAKEGAKIGLFEAVTYGFRNMAGGLTAAIFFGFFFALIFRS